MAFSRLFSKRSSPPSPGDPAPLWLFVHEDEGMAMSGAVVALVVGKLLDGSPDCGAVIVATQDEAHVCGGLSLHARLASRIRTVDWFTDPFGWDSGGSGEKGGGEKGLQALGSLISSAAAALTLPPSGRIAIVFDSVHVILQEFGLTALASLLRSLRSTAPISPVVAQLSSGLESGGRLSSLCSLASCVSTVRSLSLTTRGTGPVRTSQCGLSLRDTSAMSGKVSESSHVMEVSASGEVTVLPAHGGSASVVVAGEEEDEEENGKATGSSAPAQSSPAPAPLAASGAPVERKPLIYMEPDDVDSDDEDDDDVDL